MPVAVTAPSQTLPDNAVRWSGNWSGWGSESKGVDLQVVVESVDVSFKEGVHEGDDALYATVLCSFNSEQAGPFSERVQAVFHEDELAATFSNGATMALRMRHHDAVEFLWHYSEAQLMCGVLARTNRSVTRSHERIDCLCDEGTLEAVVFRPAGEGPFPTLVFHHGACGSGTDTRAFTQSWTSSTVHWHWSPQSLTCQSDPYWHP